MILLAFKFVTVRQQATCQSVAVCCRLLSN